MSGLLRYVAEDIRGLRATFYVALQRFNPMVYRLRPGLLADALDGCSWRGLHFADSNKLICSRTDGACTPSVRHTALLFTIIPSLAGAVDLISKGLTAPKFNFALGNSALNPPRQS